MSHETALHQWLRVAAAITNRGMPAPAEVKVYDGTDPDGPRRLVAVDLHTVADAVAWADHLGLEREPCPSPWAAAYRAHLDGFSWSVRCMTDHSAARHQQKEVADARLG